MRLRRLLLASPAAFAAFAASGADTATAVLDPAFRTLKVQMADDFFAPNIIRLGTDDRIVVSLDEMGDDHSFLRARLVHCNADWQPSSLVPSQFASGFNEMEVDDYEYSSGTFFHFVNYRLELPSPDLQPLRSGNYLLEIYREQNPDSPVARVRFGVDEAIAPITAAADSHTDRGVNTEWQQVSLAVDTHSLTGSDPFNDLTVVVSQNSDPRTARSVSHPRRVSGSDNIYEHMQELIFPAGNEFLRFETVRADYPGLRVDSVRYVGPGYHAWVCADYPRATREYRYDSTQAGRFVVREYNATDSDLGADYVTVHFALDTPRRDELEFFVDGELTHGALLDAYKLYYNDDSRRYEAQIPLKQGSYNYRYIARPRGGEYVDLYVVDGNKPETVNEYLIEVYVRDRSTGTDRLVGHSLIKSRQ